MKDSIYADWNPWHGCTKISPGCKFCYVYRQDEMYGNPTASSRCTKNAAFDLPVQRGRGGYKIPPGRIILTCFTSDFLLKDADPWRQDCWRMMRERSDCWFYFFTKRIDRLAECLPPDWGEGYDNVMIGARRFPAADIPVAADKAPLGDSGSDAGARRPLKVARERYR